MAFLDLMRDYFRGERLEAAIFILPLGVLSIAFGAALLRHERSAFVWAVAVPFLVLGIALGVTGGAVAARTSGQVAALTALYQRDGAAFVAQELPRMERVNAAWPVYLTLWCVFGIAGLVLRFGVRREWSVGLGAALLFFSGVGLLIDGFAERRARPYTAALVELSRR